MTVALRVVCRLISIAMLLAACGGTAPVAGPPSAVKAATDLKVTAQRELKLDGVSLPSLSPDGKWLVVSRAPSVCIVAVDTLADKQCAKLETGPIDLRSIVWSPDSQRIAFAENVSQMVSESDIWVLDIDNSQLSNLTDDGLQGDVRKLPQGQVTSLDSTPAWSPDGQSLLFSRSGQTTGTALYQVSAHGGTPHKILDIASKDMLSVWYGIRWLSNGKIIYAVLHPQQTADIGVWIADSNGQNAKQLATLTDPQLGAPLLRDLSARGDHALIFYNTLRYQAKPNESFFALLDLNTGRTVPLKPSGEFLSPTNAVFSPDGSKIAYVYRTLDEQVSLVVRDVQGETDNRVLTLPRALGTTFGSPMYGLNWTNNDILYVAAAPNSGLLLTLSGK